MGSFDNGTVQGGVFAQAKQFGSILRGSGPPVPAAGVVGDLYIDTQTWFLYEKRSAEATDPWGHYLFAVPAAYQSTLKWFSSSAPTNDIGVTDDYCLLWAGWSDYGMQPVVYGPKLASGWPENGEGGSVDVLSSSVLPVGLSGEGATLPFSVSTQLVVVGLSSEYVLAIPVATSVGTPVEEVGLQSLPAPMTVVIDPLYSAEDTHEI